jgi:hypothetical protein
MDQWLWALLAWQQRRAEYLARTPSEEAEMNRQSRPAHTTQPRQEIASPKL